MNKLDSGYSDLLADSTAFATIDLNGSSNSPVRPAQFMAHPNPFLDDESPWGGGEPSHEQSSNVYDAYDSTPAGGFGDFQDEIEETRHDSLPKAEVAESSEMKSSNSILQPPSFLMGDDEPSASRQTLDDDDEDDNTPLAARQGFRPLPAGFKKTIRQVSSQNVTKSEPPQNVSQPSTLAATLRAAQTSAFPSEWTDYSPLNDPSIIASPFKYMTSANSRPLPHPRPDSPVLFDNGWQGDSQEASIQPPQEPSTSVSIPEDTFESGRTPLPLQQAPEVEPNEPAVALPVTAKLKGQFQIVVDDPQKKGTVATSHIVYTVKTKTTAQGFRSQEFSVLRRYSDFLWLYTHLCHNNPGVLIPPVPDKQSIGRFSETFIAQRRLGLQSCINKMANHPLLASDADLRLFLESDNFALAIKQRPSLTNASTMLSGMTAPKYLEHDEWYENAKSYLESLENALRAILKGLENVIKGRQEISSALHEMVLALAKLSGCELSPGSSRSLEEMAKLLNQSKSSLDQIVIEDLLGLTNDVDEYVRNVASVQTCFGARVQAYNKLQNLSAQAKKLHLAHEKLKRSFGPNLSSGGSQTFTIQQSLAELTIAERRSVEALNDYNDVDKLIKAEVGRFHAERIDDLKNSLSGHWSSLIRAKEQSLSGWERYYDILAKAIPPVPPRSAPNPS